MAEDTGMSSSHGNNGASKASYVKDKLIEMIHLNETLFSCGIACSAQGHKTASGTYLIDLLLANVCKQNVTRFPYEIARLAEDIAGGLMVTMASEKDLRHPEIGKIVEKYFKEIASVPTENRCRILRLVENITLGAAAVGYRTESMHGAGSPQAQRIMISRQGNLDQKKKLAKEIAGIKDWIKYYVPLIPNYIRGAPETGVPLNVKSSLRQSKADAIHQLVKPAR
jgi:4-hydroxybutyryl-CoA dehydratase/vinylacetyl-CoA-Delta-isomerase